jgi:hypothetical protein
MIFQGNGAPLMPGQSMPEQTGPAPMMQPGDPCRVTENVSLGYNDFSSLEIASAINSISGQEFNPHLEFVKEVRDILHGVYQDPGFEPDSLTLMRKTPEGITQNIRVQPFDRNRDL